MNGGSAKILCQSTKLLPFILFHILTHRFMFTHISSQVLNENEINFASRRLNNEIGTYTFNEIKSRLRLTFFLPTFSTVSVETQPNHATS